MTAEQTLRHTSLYTTHAELGARFVPFAGWEMPVQYGSIIEETRAVRTLAGLFDVSHMGRIVIEGPDAVELLNSVLSVDVGGLRRGRARYNLICNESGGIIDDCIVYRRGDDLFLLVANASNSPAVLDWLRRWSATAKVTLTDETERIAMIACQGPMAAGMIQKLTERDLSLVRPFRAVGATVNGSDAFLARTGYTGEDGFEIMLPAEDAPAMWSALMDLGAGACGLGARDVLRLEAALLLHGNDMDDTINPYEAGLERFVEPDRAEYIAGTALRGVRDSGPVRRMAGFEMRSRGIARAGYPILDGEKTIGRVTSGGPSPTLDTNIGLGYVPTAYTEPGTRIQIEIRGRPVDAMVTALPFYRRRRSA